MADDQVDKGKRLLEGLEHRHDRPVGRFNSQGQAGFDVIRQALGVCLEGHAALEHGFGLDQQFVAAGGEGRAAVGAVEQINAQVGFEIGNRCADGRLRLAQLTTSGGERTAFDHLGEHLQLIE
ncbi:hypothetical protein D3C87_1467520 [compost metagenome]